MGTGLAVKTTGTGLISRDALRSSLSNVAATLPTVASGMDYLKMGKDGVWVYGQEENEVDDASVWAVNPASLQHGYIAWAADLGKEPLGEVMVSAMRQLPEKGSLPPVSEGKGYEQQYSVELVCVAGPDEGAKVIYKNSTVGAIKLFNVYIGHLFDRLETDSDELVALVRLSNESYQHKKYGKTFNPIFDYVEWRLPDDTGAVEEGDSQEVEPVDTRARRTTRQAAKPAPKQAEASTETDADGDPTGDAGGDDDLDAQIAALMAKKQAAAGGGAPAEAPEQETPRRRARR